MEIILQIGAHRCGTTTLQQVLDRNATVLGAAGVAAWTPGRTRWGLIAGLVQRPQDITERIERCGTRSCGRMRIEATRLDRAGIRQLILSEENMIGAIRNNLREHRLYSLADERLLRFRPAVGDRCRRIGLAIRSYEGFWASSLAYGISKGHRVPTMGMLDRLVTQPRRWRDLVLDVARVFPGVEIVVWPFERFAGRPEAQLALLTGGATAGLPLAGLRDCHNPSPRRDRLRALLHLRGDRAGLAVIPEGTGRWMPFDADQQQALRDQYREDLAWFAAGADGLARFAGGEEITQGQARQEAAPDGPAGPTSGQMEPEAALGPPPDDRGQEHERQNVMV